MGRRRCCCDCLIASDDFNRASIGSNWTAVSGSWSINSNRLSVSSSNAQIEFASTSPLPYSLYVSVRIYLEDEGDQAYVGIDDTYFVCVDRGPANGEWRLRIYSDDGGDAPPDGDIRVTRPFFYNGEDTSYIDLHVTMSSTRLSACVEPPTPCLDLASIPIDSDDIPEGKITLGTGTVGTGNTIEFDDFRLEKGYEVLAKCYAPTERCLFVSGPKLLPDGTTLDSDDWTVSGTYAIADGDTITFPGPGDGSVLTKGLHPYNDVSDIIDDYWKVFTDWEKLGATYAGETGYVYFDGLTNYVKLEFDTPTGANDWKVTAGVYKGGVLDGATKTVEGTTYPRINVCVTPTAVLVSIAESTTGWLDQISRAYTPTGSEFGVGASDISNGLGVSKIEAKVLRDVLPGEEADCPTCGYECDGCEEGTVPATRTATISGSSGDSCGDCSPMDGIFEGVYDSDYPCEWRYEDQVTLCGTTYDRTVHQIVSVPGDVDVRVEVELTTIPGGSRVLLWVFNKTYLADVDCITLSDTLTLSNNVGTLCDPPGSVSVSP